MIRNRDRSGRGSADDPVTVGTRPDSNRHRLERFDLGVVKEADFDDGAICTFDDPVAFLKPSVS